MRKKPASLSAPLRRKEEFSLFKVSDDEYKVKISPQLLLATQRFLSRGEGEGWALSPLLLTVQRVRRPSGQTLTAAVPSKQEDVQESLCASLAALPADTLFWTLSGHPRGHLLSAKRPKARARPVPPVASLGQEALAGSVCGCPVLLCWGGDSARGPARRIQVGSRPQCGYAGR